MSIIMPAFNSGATISEAIKSVLNQKYEIWELIIIDDGSKDDTAKIVSQFQLTDSRIKFIDSSINQGPSSARNTGISQSTGQFIAFLDSDDLWHPSKLNIQLDFHKSNPLLLISHTNYDMFDDNGVIKRPWKFFSEIFVKRSGILLPQLYYKNSIGILTVIVKKELISQIGLFDTKLWGIEDQDLWLRIALAKYKFGYVNQKLALYKVNPNSLSNKVGKYKKAYKSLFNKYKNNCDFTPYKLKFLANYYRYFGTVYYKNNEYKFSSLYFKKSMKLNPLSYTSATTLIYWCITILKLWRKKNSINGICKIKLQ